MVYAPHSTLKRRRREPCAVGRETGGRVAIRTAVILKVVEFFRGYLEMTIV